MNKKHRQIPYVPPEDRERLNEGVDKPTPKAPSTQPPKEIYITQLWLPDFSESTVKMVRVKSMRHISTDIKYISEESLNALCNSYVNTIEQKNLEIARLNDEIKHLSKILLRLKNNHSE